MYPDKPTPIAGDDREEVAYTLTGRVLSIVGAAILAIVLIESAADYIRGWPRGDALPAPAAEVRR